LPRGLPKSAPAEREEKLDFRDERQRQLDLNEQRPMVYCYSTIDSPIFRMQWGIRAKHFLGLLMGR
jgi:hypothetical protein